MKKNCMWYIIHSINIYAAVVDSPPTHDMWDDDDQHDVHSESALDSDSSDHSISGM